MHKWAQIQTIKNVVMPQGQQSDSLQQQTWH